MKICLVGFGKSNKKLVNILLDQGHEIYISQDNKLTEEDIFLLKKYDIPYEESHDKMLKNCDLAIISPGVNPYGKAGKIIFENNINYTTEIEYSWNFIKKANPKSIFVGITGTNGKTTTTSLLGHILHCNNSEVFVGGNIGVPLANAPINAKYYILEVSSFQLFWSKNFSPEISILLNLAPDHLNWHKDLDEYYDSKFKMLKNTQKINGLSIINKDIQKNINGNNIYAFSKDFLKNSNIIINNKTIKVENEFLNFDIYKENTVAATIAAYNLNIPISNIEFGLRSFKNLNHRIEFIKTLKGVSFYNDSKATNVHAAVNAFKSFRNKVYTAFLCGIPKNEDMSSLIDELEKNSKNIYVFGDMISEIKKYNLSDKFIFTENVDKALYMAFKNSIQNENIILSPAGASFDQFKNYEDRGDYFKKIVNSLEG
ncbi:UDP-N-acetylmuramoyl-L-alanine--D-glutamate ligase [Oceanotoga sp. DSM 15011]|uniref:UDP-N-acetylmuramoyl-L-alanine--D-glutamate ligase n=1 Tax=Oceanotoga sp. DSM 15011 TaxID=2984951 RepID=UPI0021F463B0|nr:UDP-N-acetylmuramoyl-L-alanine--D-glutamate ligase [Oceanotoga sp. DSM 15011]UYP01087.1 UDP-N-acetylmuramoyl-L-alanine--D-glutamate ligase [Oceanotoga sp. DSM 15011]